MKTLTVFIAILFSWSAQAGESAFEKFIAWEESQKIFRLMGTTLEGQIPCQLTITEWTLRERDPRRFYVSLGFGPDLPGDSANNTYLGAVITSDRNVDVSNGSIKFRWTGPFTPTADRIERPNVSNEIDIDLHSNGKPKRASGHSTLTPKRQVCIFDEPTVS